MDKMRFLSVLFAVFFLQAANSLGAYYPFPPPFSRSPTGPVYGQNHLANHAYYLELDAHRHEVRFLTGLNGKPYRIMGNINNSVVSIYWDKDEIQSVSLDKVYSVPEMKNVTDADFIKYIKDVLRENGYSQAVTSTSAKLTWRAFLEKHLGGPLQDSYYIYDLANLISRNVEVRVRFKVLRPEILEKLEMRAVYGTPFSLQAKGGHKFTLDQILAVLEKQPLAECEELMKRMPLF